MPGRMNQAIRLGCASLLLAGLSTVSVARAQTTTATLQGVVVDATGEGMVGARVVVMGARGARETVTDQEGFYHLPSLVPGSYTVTATRTGLQTAVLENVTLFVDRTVTIRIRLDIARAEQLTVQAGAPALDRSRSSLAAVISERVVDRMPVNERNYLDLVQLTPGVVVNHSAGATAPTAIDTSGAILGERAGNVSFLVDGLSNNDGFRGGPLQSLTLDAVQEFEVIATGYKAEFGQGAGGIINVITKSGTNQVVGDGFLFLRHDALDASNVEGEPPPELARYDGGVTLGGPVTEDRSWYFGSFEFVSEHRGSLFPADIPAVLADREDFGQRPATESARAFGRYTQRVSPRHDLRVLAGAERLERRHSLRSGAALPSASSDSQDVTFRVSPTLTTRLSPTAILESMVGIRGQEFSANQDRDDARSFSAFFVDIGRSYSFGAPPASVLTLDQRYYTVRSALTLFPSAAHTFKTGGEYTRTSIDGDNAAALNHVRLTTVGGFAQYGEDGFQIPQGVGFATDADRLTRIRNNGAVIFAQDDWQLGPDVTLNLGARYEIDSTFADAGNLAPRLGVAWVPDQRTSVRASWGIFYDHYRFGIAQAVPEFGGFNGRTIAELNYPRLVADALQVVRGSLAEFAQLSGDPFVLHRMFGVPFDAVVTRDNVEALTGLSADIFLDQLNGVLAANARSFLPVGFSPFTGFLRQDLSGALQDEIRVERPFDTPFNRTLSLSVERDIGRGWRAGATYVHRSIENILGVRLTNLSFESRVVGTPITTDGGPLRRTYGPWYDGNYDALILSLDTGSRLAIRPRSATPWRRRPITSSTRISRSASPRRAPARCPRTVWTWNSTGAIPISPYGTPSSPRGTLTCRLASSSAASSAPPAAPITPLRALRSITTATGSGRGGQPAPSGTSSGGRRPLRSICVPRRRGRSLSIGASGCWSICSTSPMHGIPG